MSARRPVAVLRPEPGNAATAARIEALGLAAIRLPLFRIVAREWTVPDPAGFDALLLTSAAAVRHAGPGLARLADLPVLAVGAATAEAAREAGLGVRLTGTAGVAALLADAANAGVARALHLSGRDRARDEGARADIVAARAIVYASEAIRVAAVAVRGLAGSVALLHSTRAATRLAGLVDAAGVDRGAIRLVALGEAILRAAGAGWGRAAAAARTDDAAMLAAASAAADTA